ncbi:RNA polymerase sigma factor FliA [Jejubacter calystegiae]|uniref:RNA polymerase sigma factor FliA n=1 Tax=Jejubacter calystegiae TaxID=2579935 RepID=A0A4P8YRV1_9ENTR|nr:RNA polymerase sigma factor FliA [Jejubacter calystegiae]QCT22604.1 RNA polymerase sigma factor FliA [Jejubacter calystegiae]
MNNLYTAAGTVTDKNALWTEYAPLVRHEALRLQVRLPASVELDDLIQAGMIGLLSAIDGYDPQQGTQLRTWVTQRVRWAMMDELRERDWVPRRVRSNARDVSAAIHRVEQRLGRTASEPEVAEELGVDLETYQQILMDTNTSQLFSLDELQEEQGGSMELPDEQHARQNPLQQLLSSSLRQRVIEEIQRLPEREQLLLNLYYQQELNMKEIGAVLGVGEPRVSQLHSQVIKRLRARLQSAE